MEKTFQYTLHGVAVPEPMLAELNGKIRNLSQCSVGQFDLLSATATVFGTSAADAYLSVELVMKGHENSPFFITIALPGSKISNSFTVNKRFANINQEVKNVICDFWRDVAGTLSFKGDGLSVEESKK